MGEVGRRRHPERSPPDRSIENLTNPTTTPRGRTKYYGKFINTYIYEPKEKGLVRKRLNELNPANEKGFRKKRLHQYLSEDLGLKVLRDRISKVTALLQVSPSLRRFKDNFKRMENKQRSFDFYDDAILDD